MRATAPRIGKIVLRDFRFFHGNETYTFDLGDDGKNLLLFGENGSGKSSLFHGLRLLLSETPPPRPFADYRNVFSSGEEGTVAVELTAGMPQDVKWEYGEAHPAEGGETAFFDIARRATFLDYKALLRTSVFHEDADCVNLFSLLVKTLLRDAELPDGRTVSQHWKALQAFTPPENPPSEAEEEDEQLPGPAERINEAAATFRDQLHELLNISAGGRMSLVGRANALLAKLTTGLEIKTEVASLQVKEVSANPEDRPHLFSGEEVRLIPTYAGQPIPHPALFLNEGRLTAMALALYLAAAEATTPGAGTRNLPRLLVKDRRFNAGLQGRMLGRTGWAVIWRSERGPAPGGSAQSGRPRGWRRLMGEFWGRCRVPRRECACASRGAATGRNRRESAYPLTR